MRRTQLVTQVLLVVGLWAGLMVCGRSQMFRDPGTFWHTVLGERILQTGHVERTDQDSCTLHGGAYLDSQWLAQCGMAGLYRLGGWDALLVVTNALLATVFAGLGGRLLRRGLHPLPALLLLALALAASSHQFHVRPLVLTLALTAWYFQLLAEVDELHRPVWHLALLIPATAVWANVHGGVLGGLGMLGICMAGWLYLGLAHRRGPCRRPRDVAVLLTIAVGCVLAVAVNPYGVEMPLSWWRTLSLPLATLIEEHAPLDLRSSYGLLIVLLGVVYTVVWAGAFPTARRVSTYVPLVWFVLGCLRIRNAPLFAVTAMIGLADMLPHTYWTRWLVDHGWLQRRTRGEALRSARAWLVAPVVLIVAGLTAQAAGVSWPLVGRGWARLDPQHWPVELLPELRAIESPAGTPVFNDMRYGGYLMFYTPGSRVFIDDRLELYGPFFLEYEAARWAEPGRIELWRQQYGFRHALVEPDSELDHYLARAAQWRLVKRCPAAAWYMFSEGNTVGK
jgi:hypothetical protein